MNIVVVDSEVESLQALCDAVQEAAPAARLFSFSSASETLEFLGGNTLRPDVAFVSAQLTDMQGPELAGIMKMIHPNLNLILVVEQEECAVEALALRVSGYLHKPVQPTQICEELKYLRYPVQSLPSKQIRVQCFGSFEVFVNNKPVQFLRAKSKELLAYLVDRRGARSTAAEVAAVLWEDGIYDRSRQKQFSVIRLDLFKSLHQAGAEEILLRSRDALAISAESFVCDYYQALNGSAAAIDTFLGEYMMPYPWAEFTTASLTLKFGDALV